jgi:hypothetical protein
MSLEEQLRADFDRAAQEMPLAPLSWDQTLARARRGRALRFASLTAAAALVAAAAVVGANTLADQRPTPAPPASPKPSPTELERYEVPPGAKAVVRRYVEALGAGDARIGWGLLSLEAREAVGGYERFEMLVSDTLQDGLGAFASAPDVRYFASVAFFPGQNLESDYVGTSGAVTLSGMVASEGESQPRLVVIPFEYDSGKRRVLVDQSFDGHSAVFLSGKSADGELVRGGLFEARVTDPRGTHDVSFHIDGDVFDFPPVRVAQVSDGVRLEARLPRSVTPGRHILTMILIETGKTDNSYASATEIEVTSK